MENIKEQISAIIEFKVETLRELNKEYDSIKVKCCDGLNKMKDSNLWSDKEIREINSYINELLQSRYNEVRRDIITKIRTTWVF